MTRRDGPYWQRLRKDRRSNTAAVLAAVAAISGTVSVIASALPGLSHYESRASLLYLPLMLPAVWWVSDLAAFTPRAVRLWKPALTVACLAAAASLAVELGRGEDWGLPATGLGITLAAAAGSLVLLRGSLVDREGPAR
ncbi:hypothetical protein [Roseomonas sp. WA12]